MDFPQNPESLFRKDGRLVGIVFAKASGSRTTHAIRVSICGRDTMLSISAADFDGQYERAVDLLLEYSGATCSEHFRTRLIKSKYVFLQFYGIGFKRVTVCDFDGIGNSEHETNKRKQAK